MINRENIVIEEKIVSNEKVITGLIQIGRVVQIRIGDNEEAERLKEEVKSRLMNEVYGEIRDELNLSRLQSEAHNLRAAISKVLEKIPR